MEIWLVDQPRSGEVCALRYSTYTTRASTNQYPKGRKDILSLLSSKEGIYCDIDIFTCSNFRELAKIGNMRRFIVLLPLYGIIAVFSSMYLSRIFEKCEQRKNMYSTKLFTFTVIYDKKCHSIM